MVRPTIRRRTATVGPSRRQWRGRRVAAPPQSELRALRLRLGAIDARLTALGQPLHETLSVIRRIKAPLELPPLIIRRLDDAATALKVARLVTTGLSWVPGPIGVGARAADRAIAPLVSSPPPPRGVIGNARTSMAEIDRMVAPVRSAIAKVEKPLAQSSQRLDAVHGKIVAMIALADRLLAHYGDEPPPGVEACAARINAPLGDFLDAVEEIEARLAPALATLQGALDSALAALAPLSDIAKRLDAVLRALGSKAMQKVLAPMRKLVTALEPYRKWGERIVRAVLDKLLRSIGISLKAIERAFGRLISAIDPLKALTALVARLKAGLQNRLSALLKALGIDALLDRLSGLAAKAEAEIDAFLRSSCGAEMAPATLATAKPGGRRRR